MKIIYAGTPEFAVPALQALIKSKHQVVAVYTQPDRPAGRGQRITQSPIKQLALHYSLSVEQPINFKDKNSIERLKSYRADIMIVAAYGLILPKVVLESFKFGCINIHASILPRWRGAAPIQRAIIAGDKKTGISIMQMETGLDTGPYYLIKECKIEMTDTGSSLHNKLMNLGAEALMESLPKIISKSVKPIDQDDTKVTYAKKIEKLEAKINWQEPAEVIQRKIRAFNAWPIAFTELDGIVIRVWEADYDMNFHHRKPGEIIAANKEAISVACGLGVIKLKTLQFPGKKALPVTQILHGKNEMLKIGTTLS